MNDALIVSLLSVVPKNGVARWMGRGSRLRLPAPLHRALVRWFVGKYKIDLSECVGGIDDFPTLAQFFVRALRPGVRPINADPDVLVSPVDAHVHTMGTVRDGAFEQAPGRLSSLTELLGGSSGDELDAARFEGGRYAVLYLSPQDYHRVHTPDAGTVTRARYLPGRLWPVFAAATRKVDNLFARNERLVFALDTAHGSIAQVMVGAFGVGRMSTSIGDITTNTGGPAADLTPSTPISRAQELGRFELGSTVILVTEPGRLQWTIAPGEKVRLGAAIARRAAPVGEPHR